MDPWVPPSTDEADYKGLDIDRILAEIFIALGVVLLPGIITILTYELMGELATIVGLVISTALSVWWIVE